MLPRAVTSGIRPVTLIEATTPVATVGDQKQEILDRLNQLVVGRDYQVQVLTRQSSDAFLVKIGDAIVSMALPAGTKVGDILDMTLLTMQPRSTFLLGKADGGATMSLSNAGRLISSLLQQAKDGDLPTSIIGRSPLISAGGGANAQQIASALQNAVSFSGLFYESHVAQWALGARPLTDLLREPLAKRLTTPSAAPNAVTQEVNIDVAGNIINGARQAADDARKLMDLSRGKVHDGLLAATSDDATVDKQQAAPATEAVKLMNLQLDTLEQRRIVWQGELFPGQPFQWEIEDDRPQHEHQQSDMAIPWKSTVRFALPLLGQVSATIRLHGEHVKVDINTESEETAALLKTYGGMLAEALSAAGSTLDQLQVKRDG